MEHLDLPAEQLEKLKQFTEITNIDDYDVAIGTLASLNWNVEQAIETHLMQESEDGDDEPEIIENLTSVNSNAERRQNSLPFDIHRNSHFLPSANGRARRRGVEEDVDNQLDDDVAMSMENNQPEQQSQSSRTARTTSSMNLRSSSRRGGASSSRVASSSSNAGPSFSRNTRSSRAVTNGTANIVTIDSDEDDDMRVDYDDDYCEDTNEINQIRSRNGFVPLIPENCEDVVESLRNFVTVFENRFCSKPPTSAFMPHFSTEPLPEAIKEAFDQTDCSLRRPLAIYIHNEKSIASNIFASQVLCTEAISTLLRHQYILWPWDITMTSNLRKLLEWLQILNISEVRQLIQRWTDSNVESFPLIAIVVREKGSFRLVDVCRGTEASDQVVEKLMRGIEDYENIRVTEVTEKRERAAREALRNEQEAEYHASLAADRARIEAKQREIEEQRLEEERKRKALEEETLRRQKIASLLPNEPATTEADIVHVKFRLPEGGQDMRRFRKSETLEVLINFLSSKGFAPKSFKYFNSDFPKKEVTSHFDLKKTFKEVNWPAREQIFVDEI